MKKNVFSKLKKLKSNNVTNHLLESVLVNELNDDNNDDIIQEEIENVEKEEKINNNNDNVDKKEIIEEPNVVNSETPQEEKNKEQKVFEENLEEIIVENNQKEIENKIKTLQYIKNEKIKVLETNKVFILNICNDYGEWNNGFSIALSRKWPQVQVEYNKWYQKNFNFLLGETQFIPIDNNTMVTNMLCIHGKRSPFNKTPFQKEMYKECINKILDKFITKDIILEVFKKNYDMEKRDWNIIESVLKEFQNRYNIDIYIIE